MKSTEIKELTNKEIEEKIENETSLLIRLKLNHAISPLDNPLKIKDTKKNIARLNTELRKRTLTENK
jgi:large subunit ribosomal protein L29